MDRKWFEKLHALSVGPTTIEEILALLNERPDDVELYQLLGNLYFRRGELQEAWQAFMRALELSPNDPFTCLYFGNLLTVCKDKKPAKELYEHAVRVAPALPVAHSAKADFHRSQRRWDLANDEYEKAVAVDPTDAQAQAKLAEWKSYMMDGT